jgi:hypothetical protein
MQLVVRSVVIGILVSSAATVHASTGPILLLYDHAATNSDLEYHIALHPGDQFQLKIVNTCPELFDYSINRITKTAIPAARPQGTPNSLGEKLLEPVTHDSRYAAYDVEIKKAANGTPCDTPLDEVRLRVAVDTLDWRFVQSAALAMTIAPQPRYVAEPQASTSGQPAQFKVVRDKENEDPGRFEIATLTHVYAPGSKWGLAAGFGAQENQLQYYLGVSLDPTRGSRIFNIASGVVWASIPRLPNGIHENDLITDATKLNDLPSAHRIRFFFSVTASLYQSSGQGKGTAPAK